MINYPFSSKKMCEEFLSLFQLMLDSKKITYKKVINE